MRWPCCAYAQRPDSEVPGSRARARIVVITCTLVAIDLSELYVCVWALSPQGRECLLLFDLSVQQDFLSPPIRRRYSCMSACCMPCGTRVLLPCCNRAHTNSISLRDCTTYRHSFPPRCLHPLNTSASPPETCPIHSFETLPILKTRFSPRRNLSGNS